MNRFLSISCLTAFLAIPFTPLTAQGEAATAAWSSNYEASITSAKSAGKDILLVFTSSADVKICQVLDRDILRQKLFTEPMTQKFELVRLEFPKAGTNQPVNLKAQNDLLKRAYRISGFPILIATDTEGRPYGMNGYQPIKPDEYAKIMLSMLKTKQLRDEKFAAAETATGLEKAKLLAEGIPTLPGNLMARYYRKQIETVIKNDPNNETGLVAKFNRILADVTYSQQMEALGKDVQWGKMVKLTDEYIANQKLEGIEKQRALMNKFSIQQHQRDLQNSVATLLHVVKIDPASIPGKQAAKALENLRAQKLQEDLLK